MTNPPIPPAVVEAMAAAIDPDLWNSRPKTHEAKDGLGRRIIVLDEPLDTVFRKLRSPLETAQAALSAALATGSVVICTPELKALMEAAKMGQSGALALSEITEIVDAALAYAKTPPKTGVAAHMPSRERLLEQIKADPDDDTCEARAHQEDKG